MVTFLTFQVAHLTRIAGGWSLESLVSLVKSDNVNWTSTFDLLINIDLSVTDHYYIRPSHTGVYPYKHFNIFYYHWKGSTFASASGS